MFVFLLRVQTLDCSYFRVNLCVCVCVCAKVFLKVLLQNIMARYSGRYTSSFEIIIYFFFVNLKNVHRFV